jgi:BMFP domain-containing protein YqiC
MNEPWLIVLALGLLIFVYAWIRYRADVQKERPRVSAAEMEETLEMFARELEEDNDRIIRHVSSMKKQWGEELRKLEQRVAQLEQRQNALAAAAPAAAASASMTAAPAYDAAIVSTEVEEKSNGQAPVHSAPGVSASEAASASSSAPNHPPNPADLSGAPASVSAGEPAATPNSISERYKSVLDLHHSGKSVEYIAKKTGMNKGEVQLVLTLAKREEALRER